MGERLWIDAHIHVSDVAKDGSERGPLLEPLLDVLDRCDADLRLVVSPDIPYLGRIGKDAGEMVRANEMVRDLCALAPDRLFGACMVNPNHGKAAVDLAERAFGEWGFVMLGEMLPYAMGYTMDSDATEAVMRVAVKHDRPVQVHLGTGWTRSNSQVGSSSDGMNQMADCLNAMDRVPEAKVILAHLIGHYTMQGAVSWANMYLDVLKSLYEDEWPENLWIEIRDFDAPALARTLSEVPTDRILAGTDWTTRQGPPFPEYGTRFDAVMYGFENPFPPCVGSFVGFLRDAGADEATIDRIGSGNAIDLFRLGIGEGGA